MKKIILMSCILVFAMTGNSLAACDNGTMIDSNICRSSNRMNWWSAYTWCEAQGLKLASVYDVCPSWDGSFGDSGNRCGKTYSTDDNQGWTSTAYSSDRAFAIQTSRGTVQVSYHRNLQLHSLCVAK